jgi:hypothetical protein
MQCPMRIDLTCAECHQNSFNLGHGADAIQSSVAHPAGTRSAPWPS